jgi:hypothetical protein
MAIGIIMVLGFIYGFAAMQFEKSGTSSMIVVFAYLFQLLVSFVFL